MGFCKGRATMLVYTQDNKTFKSPSALNMGAGSSARPYIKKSRFAYKSGPAEITVFQLKSEGDVCMSRLDTTTQRVKEVHDGLSVSSAHYIFSKDVVSGKARLYVSDVETRLRETPAGRVFVESADHLTLISKVFSRWDRAVSHREKGKSNNPFSRFEPTLANTGVKSSFPSIESATFGGIKGKCRPGNSRATGRLSATKAGGAVLPRGKAKIDALRAMLARQLEFATSADERGDALTFARFVRLAAETDDRIQAELAKLRAKEESEAKTG